MSTRLRTPDPATPPDYLAPYVRAAEVHGGGFASLLWASPTTQAARFDAIRRIVNLDGRCVLDAGCGRADFLEFLLARGVTPRRYVGIEAVGPLADEAAARVARLTGPGRTVASGAVHRADFVGDPSRLSVGADVLVFSGSLNTAPDGDCYRVIRRAYAAAGEAVAFNFLSSPELAGRDYLSWRRPADVLAFARSLSGDVRTLSDYLAGDCTVAVVRERVRA